jgi:hypothetical protein
MLKTLEGIFRGGKIELIEQPGNIANETRVLITFLQPTTVDLTTYGIDQEQAADLRSRFALFVEDWEQPEMDLYDDYDIAKRNV